MPKKTTKKTARKAPRSWRRRDFDEYRKTLARLEKARMSDLAAHGGRSSGDTITVNYFALGEVLEFHSDFLDDMETMVLLREMVGRLSSVY